MTVSPFPPANIELAGEVAQALCAERIGSQRDLGLNRCDAVRCEWDQIRSNFPRSDVDKGNIYRKRIASRPRSHTSLHSQKLERRNKCLPASLTLCPQVDEKQNGVECSWKPAPGAHLYPGLPDGAHIRVSLVFFSECNKRFHIDLRDISAFFH